MVQIEVLNSVLRECLKRRVKGLELRILTAVLLESQWLSEAWWADDAAVRAMVGERRDHFADGLKPLVDDQILIPHKTEPRLAMQLQFSKWDRKVRACFAGSPQEEAKGSSALDFGVDLSKARAAVSAEQHGLNAEGSTAPVGAIPAGASHCVGGAMLSASASSGVPINSFAALRDEIDRTPAYDPLNDPIREAARLKGATHGHLPENSGSGRVPKTGNGFPETGSDGSRKIRGEHENARPLDESAPPGKFGEGTGGPANTRARDRNVTSSYSYTVPNSERNVTSERKDGETSKGSIELRCLPENSGEEVCREAVQAFVGKWDYQRYWLRDNAECWFTDHRPLLIDAHNYYVRLLRSDGGFQFTKGPGQALFYEVKKRL